MPKKIAFTLISPIYEVNLSNEIDFRKIRVCYLRWKNTVNAHERISLRLNSYNSTLDIGPDASERPYLWTGFILPVDEAVSIYTSQTGDIDYQADTDSRSYQETRLRFEVHLNGAVSFDVSPTNPVYVTLEFS